MKTDVTSIRLRVTSLEAELAMVKKQLQKAPKGSLQVRRTQTTYKFFRIISENNKRTRTYLKKAEWKQAYLLARKRYNKIRKKEIEGELFLLKGYLRLVKEGQVSSEDVLYQLSGYRELLLPKLNPQYYQVLNWLKEPYEQNPQHPEGLKFKTSSGIVVRSKSEAMIVHMLEKYHIPFRYECAHEFDHHTVYPDFTIRSPKTGRIIIWEHFGLMDDSNYRENALFKMHRYTANHFIPGDNLICTYETKDHPLTDEIIERMILAYL